MSKKFLIVGAGFSGAVLANRLVKTVDCTVDVWDDRKHIGGNCYTKTDEETGITLHEYGPHIFNTNKKEIWEFVNSLIEFRPYVHRVKAMSKGKIYSFPINLHTINQLFNKTFTPEEAKQFLESLIDKTISQPKNFEEQALTMIGKELYYAFFYGYTKKQWGSDPVELPASVLKRIPVRFTYDDNYHNRLYTGIPLNGYTELFEKLLDHERIKVELNRKFNPAEDGLTYDHIFYTGPIDAYFNFEYGRLGYRSVTFEKFTDSGDHQGVTQINYCDENIPYTRISEHKHFTPWKKFDQTIYFKEYSKETGVDDIPFYPKRLEADKKLLVKYRNAAEKLNNISFLGRLATYRYMDMTDVIDEALVYANTFTEALTKGGKPPVFPNKENQ